MPLFEFLCVECGATIEVLVTSSHDSPTCKGCGSGNLKKLLSASSSLSGAARQGLPGRIRPAAEVRRHRPDARDRAVAAERIHSNALQ